MVSAQKKPPTRKSPRRAKVSRPKPEPVISRQQGEPPQEGLRSYGQQGGRESLSQGSPINPSPEGDIAPEAHSPAFAGEEEVALDGNYKMHEAQLTAISQTLKRANEFEKKKGRSMNRLNRKGSTEGKDVLSLMRLLEGEIAKTGTCLKDEVANSKARYDEVMGKIDYLSSSLMLYRQDAARHRNAIRCIFGKPLAKVPFLTLQAPLPAIRTVEDLQNMSDVDVRAYSRGYRLCDTASIADQKKAIRDFLNLYKYSLQFSFQLQLPRFT